MVQSPVGDQSMSGPGDILQLSARVFVVVDRGQRARESKGEREAIVIRLESAHPDINRSLSESGEECKNTKTTVPSFLAMQSLMAGRNP